MLMLEHKRGAVPARRHRHAHAPVGGPAARIRRRRADAHRRRARRTLRAAPGRSPRHGAGARRQRRPDLDEPRDRAVPGRAPPGAAAVPGRSRSDGRRSRRRSAGRTRRCRWPPAGSRARRRCATRRSSPGRPATAGSGISSTSGSWRGACSSRGSPRGLRRQPDAERELLAELPAMLDRIDAWIADGVLGGRAAERRGLHGRAQPGVDPLPARRPAHVRGAPGPRAGRSAPARAGVGAPKPGRFGYVSAGTGATSGSLTWAP